MKVPGSSTARRYAVRRCEKREDVKRARRPFRSGVSAGIEQRTKGWGDAGRRRFPPESAGWSRDLFFPRRREKNGGPRGASEKLVSTKSESRLPTTVFAEAADAFLQWNDFGGFPFLFPQKENCFPDPFFRFFSIFL